MTREEIQKDIIRNRIRAHYSLYNLEDIQIAIIEDALTSDEWNFLTDYDGCTAVSEFHYDKYVFDCFVHDYFWITGRGGKLSDKIFYDLMLKRGLGKYVSMKRYIGVRLSWKLFYKWKHLKNGNVRPLTYNMKLYKDLKGLK